MITKLLSTLEDEERAEINFLRAEGVDIDEEEGGPTGLGSMPEGLDAANVDQAQMLNQMLASLRESTGNVELVSDQEEEELSDEDSLDEHSDEDENDDLKEMQTQQAAEIEPMVVITTLSNTATVNAVATVTSASATITQESPMLTTGSIIVDGTAGANNTDGDNVFVQETGNNNTNNNSNNNTFVFEQPAPVANNVMTNGGKVAEVNDNSNAMNIPNNNNNNNINASMNLGGASKETMLSPTTIDAVQYQSLLAEDDLLYPSMSVSELDYSISYGKCIPSMTWHLIVHANGAISSRLFIVLSLAQSTRDPQSLWPKANELILMNSLIRAATFYVFEIIIKSLEHFCCPPFC